ncbi:hypothetical protein QWZ13_00520 [Reinekea marina]|uniref:hypothetical protein n=1 Tax=Reinekea marina TaxID=1310421 RepID=UPI0025B360FD|nr:hypothetical protein [Reinekea marina]MDN3647386.1 hypothetical protein [Reinekea marina]
MVNLKSIGNFTVQRDVCENASFSGARLDCFASSITFDPELRPQGFQTTTKNATAHNLSRHRSKNELFYP